VTAASRTLRAFCRFSQSSVTILSLSDSYPLPVYPTCTFSIARY
jgi:hypothetical protein